MAPILASYQAQITVRADEDATPTDQPLTNDRLAEVIEHAIGTALFNEGIDAAVNVELTRTDR